MSPHPLPTAVRLDAGELVIAAFEPLVEAVRDFQRFVDRVIRGQHAIRDTLGALDDDVAVDLHHGHALRSQFGRIDLYFIIALSLYTGSKPQADNECFEMMQRIFPLPTVNYSR